MASSYDVHPRLDKAQQKGTPALLGTSKEGSELLGLAEAYYKGLNKWNRVLRPVILEL